MSYPELFFEGSLSMCLPISVVEITSRNNDLGLVLIFFRYFEIETFPVSSFWDNFFPSSE